MTADRLQSIVLRLANAAHCRYWLHWNYPHQEPWLMAVGVVRDGLSGNFPGYLHDDLTKLGASYDKDADVWTFERTDGDGNPYWSNL